MNIATILAWLASPLGSALVAVSIGAAGLGLRVLLRTNPDAVAYAQDLADLAEELQPWVEEAEALNIPGAAKAALVRERFEAWLSAQDIRGQKGRVLAKYFPALREVAVKSLTK